MEPRSHGKLLTITASTDSIETSGLFTHIYKQQQKTPLILEIPPFLRLGAKMAFKTICNPFFSDNMKLCQRFSFSQPNTFLPTLLRCQRATNHQGSVINEDGSYYKTYLAVTFLKIGKHKYLALLMVFVCLIYTAHKFFSLTSFPLSIKI